MLPLLAVLAAGGWLAFDSALRQAQLVTDRLLVGSARVIAEDLHYAEGRISADIPPAALEIFASESRDRVVYRVIDQADRLIAGYGDLQSPTATPAAPLAYDLVFRAEPMRAVAFPQLVATPAGSVPVTVVVAETTKARTQLFVDLLLGPVAQQAVLVLVAAAFIWFGIGRELRPLQSLAARVQERRPEDLSAIATENLQSELRPLVSALNGFMRRLELTVTRQREFLDTAAHQLRTPLAVLKTQASYALRTAQPLEREDALRAIDEDLSGMARLANQLLLLGKAERDRSLVPRTRVDLSTLAQDVVSTFAPRGLDAGITLALDAPHPIYVEANDALLREIVVNLLENAILYAGTAATATVSIAQQGDHAQLSVIDTGPGVSDADLVRVLRRFERGEGAPGVGSGLGLSIVAELAALFGGTLEVSRPTGGGFAAVVSFPAASA